MDDRDLGRNSNFSKRRQNFTMPTDGDRRMSNQTFSQDWPLRAVGGLVDQMLDQLEAMNIQDQSFIEFNAYWSNFAKSNLNFDRGSQKRQSNARTPSETDINNSDNLY